MFFKQVAKLANMKECILYRVLRISDLHYDSEEKTAGKFDNKAGLPGLNSSQEKEFFEVLEKYLENNEVDLFIISGDIINGWDKKAQKQFSEKFIYLIEKHYYDKKNIIVIPGNHDIKKGSNISSNDRYREFSSYWKGCNFPYLDGVYKDCNIVCDKDNLLMFIPLNTANWSQTKIELSDKIKSYIKNLEDSDLKKEFEQKFTYDAAYISSEQIQYLKEEIKKIQNHEEYNKVLIQHHHIVQVDDSIEIKELPDILNIRELKEFIKEFGIRMILHGHKHVENNFYEYLNKNSNPYKLLISSSPNLNKENFFQILNFNDNLEVEILNFNRSGNKKECGIFELFDSITTDNSIIIEDNDALRLYKKNCILTKNATNKQVVCHLDLTKKYTSKNNPPLIKDVIDAENINKYKELWLSDDSTYKNELPLHGIRYYGYNGFINQEETIKYELNSNKNTSRAIAILIEPIKDLRIENEGHKKSEYPSFMSCQFIIRDEKYLDIVANFRTQEMKYWWILNVNELFELLCRMKKKLATNYKLGKITTITNKPKQAQNNALGKLHVSKIDYYADRKRVDLANLAHSLMCRNSFSSMNNSKQTEFIKEWEEIFKDLFAFTEIEKNADGNSTLRAGIRILKEHIEKAKNDKCSNHKNFLESINILIDKIDLYSEDKKSEKYTERMNDIRQRLDKTYEIYKKILEELKDNTK